MNTKQALLQFVQQIMHEGIDALIDRIANRVIENLTKPECPCHKRRRRMPMYYHSRKTLLSHSRIMLPSHNLSSHNLLSRNLSSRNQEKHAMNNPTRPLSLNKPCN